MDKTIFLFINHGWANPILDRFFSWVSLWYAFGVPLGFFMLYVFRRRWGRQGTLVWLLLVLLVSTGEVGGRFLKHLTSDARPCLEIAEEVRQPTFSHSGPCENPWGGMPSNHALNYFAAAAFVAALLRSRSWIIAAFAVATLVALSRVYLGQHYPSQVTVGATLGTLWGFAASFVAHRVLQPAEDVSEGEESSSNVA